MVYGIGTDLVRMSRIESIFEKFGFSFVKRILSSEEIKIYNERNKKIEFLAKRFAAKEAIAKAFGTGICEKLSFADISILNNEAGKPLVKVSSDIGEGKKVLLSMSDEDGLALAFAIVSD